MCMQYVCMHALSGDPSTSNHSRNGTLHLLEAKHQTGNTAHTHTHTPPPLGFVYAMHPFFFLSNLTCSDDSGAASVPSSMQLRLSLLLRLQPSVHTEVALP